MIKNKIGNIVLNYMGFFAIPAMIFWGYLAIIAVRHNFILGAIGSMSCLGFSMMGLFIIQEWA